MHVTYLKACTFPRQTTRAKGRNAAFVRNFCQRIGLVHELGQLRCTEEFLQRCRNRFAVDEVMRHQWLLLGLTQTLFHGFFDTCQTGTVLVFCQFTHTAYTAVAQMVNVVHFTTTIAQIDQNFDDRQNIFIRHHHRAS